MARPASVMLTVALILMAQRVYSATTVPSRGCPTFTSTNTYASPPLPLPYDGYMPAIDNETMWLHYNRHAGGAITVVNMVLSRYPALQPLPLAYLVQQLGSPTFVKKYNISAVDVTLLRNNGGSMINHALFWRIMTTYNTSTPTNLTAEFAQKINATWGSPAGMLDALRAAAGTVFGSGWAWVVYRPDGSLKIVTTPNQDNPLMRKIVPADVEGVPLVGVDVWEHAYYLKYRNVRLLYLAQWGYLVDWNYVQRNYNLAKSGMIDSIYC